MIYCIMAYIKLFAFAILMLVTTQKAYCRKPNIIIFLADDLGYGDLVAYGNKDQESGPLEKMAEEGVKFTQWTSAAPICTPSRSSLLTGRYARRSGIYGNTSSVFAPSASGGLPASEITLAEALKPFGYKTGMVGKWHLGINAAKEGDGQHLPHHHGFDYVGTNLPLGMSSSCEGTGGGSEEGRKSKGKNKDKDTTSTDTETGGKRGGRNKNNNNSKRRRQGRSKRETTINKAKTCFLYDGSKLVEQPIDTGKLTAKLVTDAVNFVKDNKDGPFFLYFSLPHPHPSWFCNDQFCGKSKRGDYGDVLNEMAWAVGSVLDEVKNSGIANDTLAIFSSDHGARRSDCDSVWTNGQFRDGKSTTWEGGMRVPTIAWWPGTLKANSVNNDIVSHLDIFPTAVQLAGGGPYLRYLKKSGFNIDGQLIPELVNHRRYSTVDSRNIFFYYCSDRVMAVLFHQYKIHFRTMGEFETTGGCESVKGGDYSCYDGADIVEQDPPIVVDLSKNPGETVAEDPENSITKAIVNAAKQILKQHEATFTTQPTAQLDLPTDESLNPCCNPPSCQCGGESEESEDNSA